MGKNTATLVALISMPAACAVYFGIRLAYFGSDDGRWRRAADGLVAPASADIIPAPIPVSADPQAEVASAVYDFGTVEPLTIHKHEFRIRNAGGKPLTLSSRGTNSERLKIRILDRVVPAGETGRVVASWDAAPFVEAYAARATVVTNDPDQSSIDLLVKGRTEIVLSIEPAWLSAQRIRPGEKVELETRLVSQAWDAFTIDEVQPSLAGVTWILVPMEPAELQPMKMKSGWRLAVTLPGDLPEGVFRERVRIVARPSAATSTEAVEREIPLEGKVLRRVAVYGDDIDIYGTIDAGAIDSRDGYERTFLLKVTDEEPKLRVARIETVPAFVEVRVDPYGVGDATDVRGPTDDDTAPARAAGLYRLHVRIPPRNVPAAYQGDNRGKISISFDHPRIKPLELGLDFVVLKSN